MTEQSDPGDANIQHRRHFLAGSALATGAMAGGLAAGYGMFLRCAGRFLYPSEEGTAWMFVTDAASVGPGQAFSFRSPNGVPVVITRKPASDTGELSSASDFLALSSVCPHLGCRVNWEPQNNRFYCPCHLGAFDPAGRPIAGPPLSANLSLPEYPLKIEGGLLYINMPVKPIDETTYRRFAAIDPNEGRSPASDASGSSIGHPADSSTGSPGERA